MMVVFNRILLAITGLILVAGGLLVVIEAIWAWTGNGFVWIPGHTWLSSFENTAWSDPAAIAICVSVGILGLLLLAAEVIPRRPRVVPFRTENRGEWVLLRRSTEAHLQRRLAAEVPTSPITARLKTRSRKWTLRVRARAAESTKPALERRARAELAALRAPEASQVRVNTTGASTAAS
jgi:WXXGXW repeat (2 copies)